MNKKLAENSDENQPQENRPRPTTAKEFLEDVENIKRKQIEEDRDLRELIERNIEIADEIKESIEKGDINDESGK